MVRERRNRAGAALPLEQGSVTVAIPERKNKSRLTPTKLLLRILFVVLLFYFAVTMSLINGHDDHASILEPSNGGREKKDTKRKSIHRDNTKNDKKKGDLKTTHVDVLNAKKNELTAFIEPINQDEWKIKPLPVRKTTSEHLIKKTFGPIACSKLPELWPTSEEAAPTNQDPFLPWIHDVFPSADGKYVQFVAQNKRRCQTGTQKRAEKKFFQPNIALFQHVPITRTTVAGDSPNDVRYRISSHEEADKDAVETRFICRFKPSMEETLSVQNLNYDYHTLRKAYKATFTEEGFDNHMIWSSQLLFKCPIPPSLQERVRKGLTVENDFATDFIDLVPIRTPPRYGSPTTYLPPRLFSDANTWNPKLEWGENHILPRIEDSGRFENIPICKPSLMTYPDGGLIDPEDEEAVTKQNAAVIAKEKEKKKLIACTWTSTTFTTRGEKTKVSDGDQRLLQWLEFNKLVGVDHVYVYDNSGAFSETNSLKPITDLFPGFVTRIHWPAKVCNNRPGNRDNKGERSSQYAAAMSCHLRFGEHSEWLASFDTDEYLTPVGEHDNLKQLLEKADKEDVKVLNWKSKRSKPRLQYFNITPKTEECVKSKCFEPSLPANKTFLEVYNCNIEKPPRKKVMPAEKAIYRPDFVKLFFVHYATVTAKSQLGKPETKRFRTRYKVDHTRYTDEETEGTMLHTKAVVGKDIFYWASVLEKMPEKSKLGVEWPAGLDDTDHPDAKVEIHHTEFSPNCYPVGKIDKYWVPQLSEALSKRLNPNYEV